MAIVKVMCGWYSDSHNSETRSRTKICFGSNFTYSDRNLKPNSDEIYRSVWTRNQNIQMDRKILTIQEN